MMRQKLSSCSKSAISPAHTKYLRVLESMYLYALKIMSKACSEMSSVGKWGRKSLPTKKVRKMKSSMRRSLSTTKSSVSSPRPIPNSISMYSRSNDRCSSWN